MTESKYTAPNDYRAFCESLGETETSLSHHGIRNQKWGIRRFQNKDGSYTEEGRKRYFKKGDKKTNRKTEKNGSNKSSKARSFIESNLKVISIGAAGAGVGALSGVPLKFDKLIPQAPVTRHWTTYNPFLKTTQWHTNTYTPEPLVVRERSGRYIGTAAAVGGAAAIGGYLGYKKIREAREKKSPNKNKKK